mmetsp:Transcript_37133/g.56992  ORF Transcript_37133/g.56992 Transcript_37133/m.56992 type:complete len:86 (+) Transcript_37133:1013-1270(+)
MNLYCDVMPNLDVSVALEPPETHSGSKNESKVELPREEEKKPEPKPKPQQEKQTKPPAEKPAKKQATSQPRLVHIVPQQKHLKKT